MTKSLSLSVITVLAILTMIVIFAFLPVTISRQNAFGALTNSPATVATTTIMNVSTTAIPIEATSSCTTRIITTYASPIMLTFSDVAGQVPSGIFGYLQAASTTVAYDAGQFGCGLVRAFSFASQAITISDSR